MIQQKEREQDEIEKLKKVELERISSANDRKDSYRMFHKQKASKNFYS